MYAGYLNQDEMMYNGRKVAMIISQNYNSMTDENDIALMKLKEPLPMSGRAPVHILLAVNINTR